MGMEIDDEEEEDEEEDNEVEEEWEKDVLEVFDNPNDDASVGQQELLKRTLFQKILKSS